MIEPLRLAFEVACPVDHAFDTWTAKTSMWWPVLGTSTGEPGCEVNIEPRVGGRVFERTPSGQETDWGEVTTWDPPRRLGYLWHIMTERSRATDVEIRFSESGPNATLVEIVHSGWERLGADGAPWRDRNNAGWNLVLPHYVEACTRSG